MNPRRSDLLATALWTLAFLIAADFALGRVFRMPADPRQPPAPLAQYFDFGASIESKMRRMVAAEDSASAPVALAGWLEPFNDGNAPLAAPAGRRLVAVYGQSFTFQLTQALAALDSTILLRTRGGPSSPASHGYAFWQSDRGRVHAEVAILGVLASSVRGLDASSAATWEFEAPPLYTYPRYRVDARGRPVPHPPYVLSLAGVRAALADPVRMRAWQAQLARDDDWYDPLLWRASWLDHSVFARVLRRAWAQRQQREHLARVHGRAGFREDSDNLRTLRALIGSFVEGCRADGTLPVVLLLEDAGYADHLSRALGPELDRRGALWMGTHELADAGNPANLKADGHFIPALNERLARALLARLDSVRGVAGPGIAPPRQDSPRRPAPASERAGK
ncbi:MAG: hypothetical protein IT347_09265 [Candidatus Eisenbacteria bacterium]|nr:hypothetical protein [Candidatus Eisenbacteria bacterium]